MTNTQRNAMQQAVEALNVGIMKMNALGCAIECMPLHYADKALRKALAEPSAEPIPLAATCHCACVVQSGWVVEYCKMHGSQLIASPPPSDVPLLTFDDGLWQFIADTLGCFVRREQKDAIEQAVMKKAGIK